MKPKLLYYLIAILIITNLFVTYRCYILKKELSSLRIVSEELNKSNKFNKGLLQFNYSFSNKLIDTSMLLVKESVEPIEILLLKGNRLVLYYDKETCNACEEDLFKALAKIDKKLRDEMFVIIPMHNFNDFRSFNETYKLNFHNIFGYKGDFLGTKEKISQGIFFYLNKNLSISEIYIPEKPIVFEEIAGYFQKIFVQ